MAKKQSEDTVTITVTEDALSVTINDDPSVPAFTLNLDLFGQVRSDVRVASDKERNGVTPSVRDSYVVAAPPDTAFVSPNGLQLYSPRVSAPCDAPPYPNTLAVLFGTAY